MTVGLHRTGPRGLLQAMNLTREQCREMDRRAMHDLGVPGIVLMENAGRAMAELLVARVSSGPVVICCGKGNNGGDGMVIARHLAIAGILARVVLFAEPEKLPPDAAVNWRILTLSGADVAVRRDDTGLLPILSSAVWVVDALFGTGLASAVRAPLSQVIEAINACGRPVLAVDIPSGLDADTGRPMGACVRATLTATVLARKAGFDAPEAKPYLGEVAVVGMGAPPALLKRAVK
jgi:NAD(P)H-hydrate epimerase